MDGIRHFIRGVLCRYFDRHHIIRKASWARCAECWVRD